jgi:hypothetical protein
MQGGRTGQAFPGGTGIPGTDGAGNDGGVDSLPGGRVTIVGTNITGNNSTTQGDDVFGTISNGP